MRSVFVLLFCLMLFACGKTGPLYLPEEPDEQAQQDEPTSSQQTVNDGKAD